MSSDQLANSNPAPRASDPTISPCDFQSAGRLSNDNIRSLRTMHEAFARSVAHSLDLFLGSPMGVKLVGVEQIAAKDFTAKVGSGSYLVPFTLLPLQNRIMLELESSLLFPLVDLLLGGSGERLDDSRELTDIDEELIRSVTELISVQMERTWKACNVSVSPGASLRLATAGQIFAAEERLISTGFEVTLGTTIARMQIILPIGFCHALVRSSHLGNTRTAQEQAAGTQRLRERLLDCTMTLLAELSNAQITVGEMIDMRPGAILNLRTSVKTPVRLGINEYPLFEMTPVRRGVYKTAQLGRRCLPAQETRR